MVSPGSSKVPDRTTRRYRTRTRKVGQPVWVGPGQWR